MPRSEDGHPGVWVGVGRRHHMEMGMWLTGGGEVGSRVTGVVFRGAVGQAAPEPGRASPHFGRWGTLKLLGIFLSLLVLS